MFVVMIALIVVVNAALIVAVVRFRERRGREPARFAAGRGALRPVLGVLSVLALAIFIFGVIQTDDAREIEPSGPNGSASTDRPGGRQGPGAVRDRRRRGVRDRLGAGQRVRADRDGPLQIDAIAQQWLWRFEYPGGRPGDRTFSYGELVVPVDTAVVLNITSTDVLHSWHVPALGGQVQASPGEVVQTWFKADEVGRYGGSSTVFSGTSFPAMRSWVRVVTVPEYQAYVKDLGAEMIRPSDRARRQRERVERRPMTPPAATRGPAPRSSAASSKPRARIGSSARRAPTTRRSR